MKIGMIGLGRMGSNMVRRLAKSGHSCVVYDNNAAVPAGGIQDWHGNLGLDFTVNQAVTVTALGAFDNGIPANLRSYSVHPAR